PPPAASCASLVAWLGAWVFAMSSSSTGPRCFSSSALICGQRLPQLPLFAIGLTMILVFTAIPRSRRQSRQLDVGGGMKQPESELFADATNCCGRVIEAARVSRGDAEASYEKKA